MGECWPGPSVEMNGSRGKGGSKTRSLSMKLAFVVTLPTLAALAYHWPRSPQPHIALHTLRGSLEPKPSVMDFGNHHERTYLAGDMAKDPSVRVLHTMFRAFILTTYSKSSNKYPRYLVPILPRLPRN